MKTAVEWLISEIQKYNDSGYEFHPKYNEEILEQAKEMEKQQIIDAVEWGNRKGYDEHTLTCIHDDDVKYYNITFKSE